MLPEAPNLPVSFTASQAVASGLSRGRLRSLVEEGHLERLARGLYRHADAPLADLDLVEVALRAPLATLCLESALAHHGLTDRIPGVVDVALPRSRRQPATAAPVRWHRFDEATFELGRAEIDVEPGLRLGLYSADRSVVDVFRLRHQEGADLAHEALRRWLRDRRGQPSVLLDLASRFPNVVPGLRTALEFLL